MNTDAAATWLTWLTAGVCAAALVAVVLVHQWAARVLVIAVAALFVVVALSVRTDLVNLPTEQPEALCTGGVSWFGVHLTGPAEVCARYR